MDRYGDPFKYVCMYVSIYLSKMIFKLIMIHMMMEVNTSEMYSVGWHVRNSGNS